MTSEKKADLFSYFAEGKPFFLPGALKQLRNFSLANEHPQINNPYISSVGASVHCIF